MLNYKTFMELQMHSDALMCKVFLKTLTRPAHTWFNSLKPKSVRNSIDLANIFIGRFIAGVQAGRKISYLEKVKQRQNKSLREYVTRFNSKALHIPKLDEARAVEAMQRGTTSPEFFRSLFRMLPNILSELLKRAEKYIRQDNALTTNQFAREDKEGDRGIDDRRKDVLERRMDRGLKALNKHRWEKKNQ